jgi:Zn-finger nucleic acid-binding protein
MDCPKCLQAMEPVMFESVEVDRCTNCGGIWFDLQEHEHLRLLPGSQAIDTGSPELGERYDQFRDIDCPRCGVPMIKMRDAARTDLQYESCKVCYGIYFDAGEFSEFKKASLRDFVRFYIAARPYP